MQHKNLEVQPGRSVTETFELRVNKVLNCARDDAGTNAHKSLKDSNINVKAMVTASSKGSFINVSQVKNT
jgi:DNA-directed RNA polymerase II subunit RPB1